MKAFTDIQQSKKLAEILPIESADHHYVRKTTDFIGNPVDGEWSHPKYGNPNSKYANYMVQNFTTYETVPCWSLAALLEVLPTIDDGNRNPVACKDIRLNKWHIVYHGTAVEPTIDSGVCDNLIDACFEMIIKLNEQKLLCL